MFGSTTLIPSRHSYGYASSGFMSFARTSGISRRKRVLRRVLRNSMNYTAFVFLIFIVMPIVACAQSSGEETSFTLPTTFDEIIQKLPRPLTDFLNSLYPFGSPMPNSLMVSPYAIPAIPQHITANSLFDFVKQLILFIGGFLVVILRVIASVIEWVIPFISQRFSS